MEQKNIVYSSKLIMYMKSSSLMKLEKQVRSIGTRGSMRIQRHQQNILKNSWMQFRKMKKLRFISTRMVEV